MNNYPKVEVSYIKQIGRPTLACIIFDNCHCEGNKNFCINECDFVAGRFSLDRLKEFKTMVEETIKELESER